MIIKKTIAICLILGLLVSCCSQKGLTEQTVYITSTGSMYHISACRYLGTSSMAIPLSEAVARKYEPCTDCRPPVSGNAPASLNDTLVTKKHAAIPAEKIRCAAFTKKGPRCRRVVKKEGDKCFQHTNKK